MAPDGVWCWEMLELAGERADPLGFWVPLTSPVQRLRIWSVLTRGAQSLGHPTCRDRVLEKEGFLE